MSGNGATTMILSEEVNPLLNPVIIFCHLVHNDSTKPLSKSISELFLDVLLRDSPQLLCVHRHNPLSLAVGAAVK